MSAYRDVHQDVDGQGNFTYGDEDRAYDPSEEYLELMRLYYPDGAPYQPHAFHGFPNLADSLTRCLAIANRHRPEPAEAYRREALDRTAIGVVTYLRDGLGMSPEEIHAWEDTYPDLFRDHTQAKAGAAYIDAFNAQEAIYDAQHIPLAERHYPAYAPPDAPSRPQEIIVAEAWMRQARTHDPLDIWIAQSLLDGLLDRDRVLGAAAPADNISAAQASSLLQHTEETGWAAALLQGADIATTFQTMREFAVQHPSGDTSFSVPLTPPGTPVDKALEAFFKD